MKEKAIYIGAVILTAIWGVAAPEGFAPFLLGFELLLALSMWILAVGLDHFIRSLPDGYDTVLDDKSSLSQGQKQLLTIARAMVQDAPILILDEATSSVDTRTEELIQKAMDALTVGRTSFVIAHRLSTIRDADMILVRNHRDVVVRGTRYELLAAGGFYADLYNSQFALAD